MGKEIFLLVAILFLQILITILVFTLIKRQGVTPEFIKDILERNERIIRQEFSMNRDEMSHQGKDLRNEVVQQFKLLGDVQGKNFLDLRELLVFRLDTSIHTLNELQKEIAQYLEKIKSTLEIQIKSLQEQNEKKLDEMRQIVDEKLQSTLEKRLSDSFKQVSERLELVHKGLGEMQVLATGVGDLKKVLTNVKTRGVMGEVQLENILEQLLSPDQMVKNVTTRPNSKEFVEFAIKLPGREEQGQEVLLPLDAKFPLENYYQLLEAYDSTDPNKIANALKNLENDIKKAARDIRDKYIETPYTTDFGIMFLPVEGLYAEVVRRTNLLETLQRDYKIIVTGPTTLAAILHSLQMGFRTLAIEKRSSEVWKVLGAVKTEFGKFSEVLKKAQEKLNKASDDLDTLVGTRTRQIELKLRNVTAMPLAESSALLPDLQDQNMTDDPDIASDMV